MTKRTIFWALAHIRSESPHQSCRWKRISRSHPPKKMSSLCPKTIDSKNDDTSKGMTSPMILFWNQSMTNNRMKRIDWFQRPEMVPTTDATKILENDHTFVQLFDLYLSKTLIDFQGPRQRCMCLHQYTTFIFCLTKQEITLFTLSCPTWWSCGTVVFHGPKSTCPSNVVIRQYTESIWFDELLNPNWQERLSDMLSTQFRPRSLTTVLLNSHCVSRDSEWSFLFKQKNNLH